MSTFHKIVHIKQIAVIICFFIVAIPNIDSQCNYSNPNCEFKLSNYISNQTVPSFNNLYCQRLSNNLTLCIDSLQLSPLRYNLDSISKFNYTQSNLFKSSFENTDSLRSCFMYKQAYKLTPPNIKFHYNPSLTTYQGIGILLMGISRTILFPTAPDYRIEP